MNLHLARKFVLLFAFHFSSCEINFAAISDSSIIWDSKKFKGVYCFWLKIYYPVFLIKIGSKLKIKKSFMASLKEYKFKGEQEHMRSVNNNRLQI
jgi:hypothetical protein